MGSWRGMTSYRCSMGICSSRAGFGVRENSGRHIFEDDWASLAVSHLAGAFLDGRWCTGERRRSRQRPCTGDGRRVQDERVSLDGLSVCSVGVCGLQRLVV